MEPPNKGHLGTRASVLYSEVSYIRSVLIGGSTVYIIIIHTDLPISNNYVFFCSVHTCTLQYLLQSSGVEVKVRNEANDAALA